METTVDFASLDSQHIIQTYRRYPGVFVRGEGCYVWDEGGKRYLDMLAGIAVCALGHCHPALVEAITSQAKTLMHTSNLMLTPPVAKLAAKLSEISGMERTFFAVCGATANETGLKIGKAHGLKKCPSGDYEIIALRSSFHGRTCGVLSITANEKYQAPFRPLLPNIKFIEPNDVAGMQSAFSAKTAAIVMEPVQGEGGINPMTPAFFQEARRLCDAHDALLLADEVQCGMGRTGTWFYFQQLGAMPDTMALAKGLGSGMPIGACLARGKAAEILSQGMHGSTFGGNPLMAAAGLAVIETIEKEGLRQNASEVGAYLVSSLQGIDSRILEVRGVGLMVGVLFDRPIAREVVRRCLEKGLIINATGEERLRFVPPLILTKAQVDEAVAVLKGVLSEMG
ncbi:MAG: acetylornithine transaminase [Fimbriimonadaceae bacterium]|nr:acetylornithine transaminase [Fimbriimonadaceae bacterium]